MDVLLDRQAVRIGLQVLTDGDDANATTVKIVKQCVDLLVGFPQSQHQSRFHPHPRMVIIRFPTFGDTR